MQPSRSYLKRADESHDAWLRRVGVVRVTKSGDFEEVVAKNHKDTTMTTQTRDEFLTSVVKQYGVAVIAKYVLATGPDTQITEHEFVAACGKDFVKLYTDPGEDGLILRKALNLIKNAQWAARAEKAMPAHGPEVDVNVVTLKPRAVGGRGATGAVDGSGGTSAYDELQALAAEQRKKTPFMTPEQCFAAVYQDTANVELVNRERFEARSRMTSAYPGWPS